MDIILSEQINVLIGSKVLLSEPIAQWSSGDKRRLVSTLSLASRNQGSLQVSYFVDNKNKVGRFKTRVKDEGNSCPLVYCLMQREVRAWLAHSYYYDLDLVNCHPKILYALCIENELHAPCLYNYIQNRGSILTQVTDSTGVSKDQAKTLFISILFGASISTWCKDHNNISLHLVPGFVHDFRSEVLTNAVIIMQLKKYQYILDYCIIYKQENPNIIGVRLSMLLQTLERQVIESLVDIVQKDGYTVGSIIYDGLHIDKSNGPLTNKLKYWGSLLNQLHPYELELSIKEFELVDWYCSTPQLTTPFDFTNFNTILLYNDLKPLWETRAFKILNQNMYVVIDSLGGEQYVNETRLKAQFRHLRCLNIKQKRDYIEEEVAFIDRWICDINIRQYEFMKMLPPPLVPDEKTFNMWRGFGIEAYKPDKPVDPESIEVKTIYKFIHYLLKENESSTTYMLNWLASIIQSPATKPPGAAIVLYSSLEGTGKNTLATGIIKELLGSQLYFATGNPMATLYGSFSKLRENRLVICIDENNPSVSFANNDVIKNMITETTFTCNEKYMCEYVADCRARFIFTTNSPNSINIGPGERRFVVFETSHKYAQNKTYFNEIYSIIKNKHSMYEFFTFLRQWQISGDIVTDRPVTYIYRAVQEANTPTFDRWLREYLSCQAIAIQHIMLKDLYDLYKNWLINNGYKKEISITKFGIDMRKRFDEESEEKIVGITLLSRKHGIKLQFDIPNILTSSFYKAQINN